MGICKETPEELKSSLIFLSPCKPVLLSQTGHEAIDHWGKEFT